MAPKKSKTKHRRTVLRLSDLDHSKSAVLNSLISLASRRTYEYAIEEFKSGCGKSAGPTWSLP
ncbi:MAG TPA: hypothetical protein VII29_09080 [Terriglobales bacterium]|jgi:predicted HAD superfamily hydrolase